MKKKYYFVSYYTYQNSEWWTPCCQVVDEHPFDFIIRVNDDNWKAANEDLTAIRKLYVLQSWQEVTKAEYKFAQDNGL